jgi:hypothetical protein
MMHSPPRSTAKEPTEAESTELAIRAELQAQLRFDADDVIGHKTAVELAEVGRISRGDAEARIELLKGLEVSFNKNVRLLKARELTVAERDALKRSNDSFYDNLCQAIGAYKEIARPTTVAPLEHVNGSFRFDDTHTQHSVQPTYKLPVFTLPTFDGSFESWIPFKETFTTMIHENADIPKVVKYSYLRSAVKVRSILDNYGVSERYYDEAWKALCDRHDDEKKKKTHLFNKLMSIKHMSGESVAEITRIIDEFSSVVTSLTLCNATFDDMLMHIVQFRLDDLAAREWHKHLKTESEPTFAKMMEFLTDYSGVIASLFSNSKKSSVPKPKESKPGPSSKHFQSSSSPSSACSLCGESHILFQCPKFRAMTVDERFKFVSDKRLCRNCLAPGHQQRNCTSCGRCRSCKKPHSTLLHFDNVSNNSPKVTVENRPSTSQSQPPQSQSAQSPMPFGIMPYRPLTPPQVNYQPRSNVCITQCAAGSSSSAKYQEALLTTVSILALGADGEWKPARALLDSGSQGNHVTLGFAKELGLELKPSSQKIFGINGQTSTAQFSADVHICSRYKKFHAELVGCFVSDDITGTLPPNHINPSTLNIPRDLLYADPLFYKPGKIDLLLGTGVYHDVILANIIRQPNCPTVMETMFGWGVGGQFPVNVPMPISSSSLLSCYTQLPTSGIELLDAKIEKFMELVDCGVSTKKLVSREHQFCLDVFDKTTVHDVDAKQVTVCLPMNNQIDDLESNFDKAFKQFRFQEQKRLLDDVVNRAYVDYMDMLLSTGRMTEVSSALKNEGYYLPHHAVLKSSSTTTAVRPVYNASSVSKSGKSLNQCLCVGPIVQPDLFDVLVRFRLGKFLLKSDVEKMYLNVHVHESQRAYQKILWRRSTDDPLKHYTLNRVTFGLAPSSFLATNTLNFIAKKYSRQFPEAVKIILSCFYVDDFVFSFDDFEEGLKIRDQIRFILMQISFPMRKWLSNRTDLLVNLPASDLEAVGDESMTFKTLGISYNPRSDEILFPVKNFAEEPHFKANLLAEIASLYDPIGWIGPVIVTAKIHMKKTRKLKWKDELPGDVKDSWCEFRSKLPALAQLSMSRHSLIANAVVVSLHGFADASLEAYGCVFYIRSCDSFGNVKISLLTSKSRVAPPKQQTIARLELCAATLMSRLLAKIRDVLTCRVDDVTLWTDSMIVLFWIASEASEKSVFVGNRAAVCQELSVGCSWRHCSSQDNPADKISRGMAPDEIQECRIWWNGPEFLKLPEDAWPETRLEIVGEDKEERDKEMRRTFVSVASNPLLELIETRFSSMQKVINTIAYLRRLAFDVECRTPPLSIAEKDYALDFIVRWLQKSLLSDEYKFLLAQIEKPEPNRKFPPKSPLHQLAPFMDDRKIICVGGRIGASPALTAQQKHPMILPRCQFTKLIVRWMHRLFMHPGNNAMLSYVREYYWPLNVKAVIRQVKHECIVCFRYKPQLAKQIMSNLPLDRVQMSPPFSATAVDYAGPIDLKVSLARKSSNVKAYIAVFKCMSTGAVHFELVTSLSTAAFIDAFDRFVSRRGLCRDVYSDNGTCFQGANNEFVKILKSIEAEIGEKLAEKSIRWHFTTPMAPHAGGIYESGVKSMKTHLVKECAYRTFDYELLMTLLCKIEAIVNSRPLTPLSDDPDDFEVLTPAHFLIGRSLVAKPERNFLPVPMNRLNRYQELQRLQQKLWNLWYHDYLHHLQTRPLKFRKLNEFRVGDLVLLKDNNLPPLKWKIGRVKQLFPDKFGVVRNVLIKMPLQTSDKHRHIKYLAFLPLDEQHDKARGENVRYHD